MLPVVFRAAVVPAGARLVVIAGTPAGCYQLLPSELVDTTVVLALDVLEYGWAWRSVSGGPIAVFRQARA